MERQYGIAFKEHKFALRTKIKIQILLQFQGSNNSFLYRYYQD